MTLLYMTRFTVSLIDADLAILKPSTSIYIFSYDTIESIKPKVKSLTNID